MNLLLLWVVRLIGGALVLSFGAALLGGWLVSRSLPEFSGEIALDDLSAPVEIVRDANAVPHIRAATAEDAWYALGLVHAQDRLWQMEVNRRAAQGRLSVLFGPSSIEIDRLMKTLDIYGSATRAVQHQSARTRAALDAYAAGVNAWIRHVNAEARGRGAPEFFVFPTGLSPWQPADSLAIIKVMALRLSGAAAHEVRRARLQLALPPERVRDLLPDAPGPAVTSPARYSDAFPGLRYGAATDGPEDPWMTAFGPSPMPELAGASNAWAIDGSRSASGAPLLANDPHLWLSAPSVWYLAHVSGGDLAVTGGTLPGVPAVLIGRNDAVGWGLTTAHLDDQDIFIEQVDPDDPLRYRTPDGWDAFGTRQIRIDVDGSDPVIETVRTTRHGPVLGPDQFGVGPVTPENHVAALAWTALSDDDTTMTASMDLGYARTLDDAVAATRGAVAPAQNVTIADKDDVAMVVAGRVPGRQTTSTSRGRLPSPGWLAENDWDGWRPLSRRVEVIRPASGAVANTNNRTTDAPFPDHLTNDWPAPYRIQRLERELTGRAFHSRDSFAALQFDSVSAMARAILPMIARDLWWREGASVGSDQRRRALEMLANWTGDMDRHSPEPLIFAAWLRNLTNRIAGDELGPLLPTMGGARPLFLERVFRDIDGAGVWCDIDKTPEAETCSEMASLALDDALVELTAGYGNNIDGWRWGEAHFAVHRHVPLGQFGPLGLFVNIEQETSGGDHTLNRGQTRGTGERPYQNVHASGLRMVLDFADLDRSLIIISTGQSGHPLSQYYDHLAELWVRGEMIPMSMKQEDAESGALGTLRLVPR